MSNTLHLQACKVQVNTKDQIGNSNLGTASVPTLNIIPEQLNRPTANNLEILTIDNQKRSHDTKKAKIGIDLTPDMQLEDVKRVFSLINSRRLKRSVSKRKNSLKVPRQSISSQRKNAKHLKHIKYSRNLSIKAKEDRILEELNMKIYKVFSALKSNDESFVKDMRYETTCMVIQPPQNADVPLSDLPIAEDLERSVKKNLSHGTKSQSESSNSGACQLKGGKSKDQIPPSLWSEIHRFSLRGFTLGLSSLSMSLLYYGLVRLNGESSPAVTYFVFSVCATAFTVIYPYLLLSKDEPRRFTQQQIALFARLVLNDDWFESLVRWTETNTET